MKLDFDLEMAYTSWHDSCKDPLLPTVDDERACRRPRGHNGYHSSGFVATGNQIYWDDVAGRD